MRIAVYSGSFNPLHIGHLSIVRHLTEKMGFGCVYLVVSPKNPLKDSISAESGMERYLRAVRALEHSRLNVRADDIELSMSPPHYTIRTLDALRNREPENSFTLVIGADNLRCFRKWKDYRRILLEYGVVVFPRKGTDVLAEKEGLESEDSRFRIEVADAPMVDVSSTMIREGLAEGKDMSGLIAE